MTPAYRRPWLVTGATTLLLLATLTGCKEAGWAKDEELNQMKPPAGQLPPLPTSSARDISGACYSDTNCSSTSASARAAAASTPAAGDHHPAAWAIL